MSLRNGLVLCVLVGVAGCAKQDAPPQEATTAPQARPHGMAGHSHDGWWCNEHGLPEEVCTLCNATLVADFKAKGDWCTEHDRPESQCFICHPEHAEKFAAQYEAKYGKKPPQPGETDGHDHDHDHHGHDHEHEG